MCDYEGSNWEKRVKERLFSDAICDGRDAYKRGDTKNPHPEGTAEHQAWRMGYNEARDWTTARHIGSFIKGGR